MNVALETLAREAIAFLTADSTLAIVSLIGFDLLTGIIAALRTRQFDIKRIGNFYLSNVIPYVIGYAGLYVFTGIGLAERLPAGIIDLVQPLTSAPAIAALVASIVDNVQRSRYVPTPPHDADPNVSISPPAPPIG